MKLKLISEKEAAELLNCSVYALQRQRRVGGHLPFYKVSRSVKYSVADIESYLESQRFTSTSQYNKGV